MFDDAGVLVSPLSDEIQIMAPGRELAGVLASIDRGVLSDQELVWFAQARVRQIAHEQAELMADLVAVAERCEPRMTLPPAVAGWRVRGEEPIDHAVDEIAAGLTWTQTAAANQLELAERVVAMPLLHQAMLGGELDWPKVKLIADQIQDLDPDVQRRVLLAVLDYARTHTTGQLRAKLKRLVLQADPDATSKRYRRGLRERRVELGHEHDGTASLSGRNLPVDAANAAFGRVRAIADWVKDGGDPRDLEQIRADVMLALLLGNPVPGPDGQDTRPVFGAGGAVPATRNGVCGTCGLSPLARGLELTAPLETLLGLANKPAELGSWGPVIAEIAHTAVQQLRNRPWHCSVTDNAGRVIAHTRIRGRPTTADIDFIRARDRRGRFPGCRRPARRAEIDHTTPRCQGGCHHPHNLGLLCGRHHALKSNGTWTLEQLENGTFVWRSNLGQTHIVRPEEPEDDDP